MNTKHTPGPWFISKNQWSPNKRYLNGETFTVPMSGACTAVIVGQGCDIFEQESNARLIASAPDLLAMLERVTNQYATLYGALKAPSDPIIEESRALIATIKGE